MPADGNDVRYYHAVTAMRAILDELEKQPGIPKHRLAGVIVCAVLEAMKAYEQEMSHV
jgi:hypothetical protein